VSSTFSPLKDQPHYIFAVAASAEAGSDLAGIEQRLPGVLAYGHFHRDRRWYRMTKMLQDNPNAEVDSFDHYRAYVPVNAAWLFERQAHNDGLTYHVEHAINVDDIFAWPTGDAEGLATMAEYGRQVVRRMVESGEVKPFVADLITDYQARGVYWSSTRPWAKLVYPCGSGKTLTSMLSALTRPGAVCVVAPAKARRVWWDQVQEYTNVVPYRVIPQGQMRRDDQTFEQYLEDCRVEQRRPFVVFGAQSLPDHVDKVAELQPSVLVFDELHTFGQAKRWKAVFNSAGEVEFEKRRTNTDTRETRAVAAMDVSRLPSLRLRIGLTATPLDDGRPRRVWSQLDLLAPGSYGMGFYGFAKRYCAAKEGEYGGLDDKGSSHIDELKLRASYLMQEVTHTESHGQLPPTRVQVVWLDPSDQNRPAAFKRLIAKAEKEALKTRSEFDQERALEANLMEAASRKRTYVIDEVLEGLRGGGKVVLFTARRQDCEDWMSYVEKALTREVAQGLFGGAMPSLWWGHGGTDEREREDMVSAFRQHDGPCLLIGTGQAFGESVDGLQTADLAIFAMLPWRPGDFEQWKGRFDRIGGRPTLLKVVLARKTYDEKVAGILADKITPIQEFLAAEQYQGMDDKLLGIDDHNKMKASVLTALFGEE
jgi:hypothetical protein